MATKPKKLPESIRRLAKALDEKGMRPVICACVNVESKGHLPECENKYTLKKGASSPKYIHEGVVMDRYWKDGMCEIHHEPLFNNKCRDCDGKTTKKLMDMIDEYDTKKGAESSVSKTASSEKVCSGGTAEPAKPDCTCKNRGQTAQATKGAKFGHEDACPLSDAMQKINEICATCKQPWAKNHSILNTPDHPFKPAQPATTEEIITLKSIEACLCHDEITEQPMRRNSLDVAAFTLRAHVQKEIKDATDCVAGHGKKAKFCLECYKNIEHINKIEKQQAVEKAMGELRNRIIEGQKNFRTHNMTKDANTLEVVISEINIRYPNITKAQLPKESERGEKR